MARPPELTLDESSSAGSPRQSPGLDFQPRSTTSASNPSNFSKLGERNIFTIKNGGFKSEKMVLDHETWWFNRPKSGFDHEK
jgi:hypothetical protein